MHYRDDHASLEARRDDLRHELAELTRKADALRALTRDEDAVARELAAVEARLAHQTARRLPLLDRVRIAAPCPASWDEMTGDGRVRFCEGCQKSVYNLSALARDEAERLLAEREGSICVRLYQRADGTVMTDDCSVGVKRRRRRQTAIALAGVGAMAATGALAVSAMWAQGKPAAPPAPAEPSARPMMGAVAWPVEDEPRVAPSAAPSAVPSVKPPAEERPRPLMGKPSLEKERHDVR